MTEWAADEKKNVSTANFHSSALSIKHWAYTCECAANCRHDIAHHQPPPSRHHLPTLASSRCRSAYRNLFFLYFLLFGWLVCVCVCVRSRVLQPFSLPLDPAATLTVYFFCILNNFCRILEYFSVSIVWRCVRNVGLQQCFWCTCFVCVCSCHAALSVVSPVVNARVRAKLLRWMPFEESRCVRNARGEWMRRWNRMKRCVQDDKQQT